MINGQLTRMAIVFDATIKKEKKIMNKYKSSFFNNCYEWLFTVEERAPLGFVPTFFMIIVISIVTGLFIIPMISKLM